MSVALVDGSRANGPPPVNDVVEQAVLGAILADRPEVRKAAAEVIPKIPALAFPREDFQTIWKAIQAGARDGSGVDVVSIGERLRSSDQLDRVGGWLALNEIADTVPGSDSLRQHAEILRARHERREVSRVVKEALRRVEEAEEGPAEVFAFLSENLRRVRAGASRSFRFLSAEDMEAQGRPEPLVEGILPKKGIGAVAGPPGCGKSFTVLDVSCAVAAGLAWLDKHATAQGEVLYVCAEGSLAFGERVRAWKSAHAWTGRLPLTVVPQEVNLMEPGSVAVFIQEALEFLPQSPALVVFDTLSLCMLGGEENAASDMNQVISSAKVVRDGLDCAVLIVHHAGHNGKRERGSTALRGGVDTMAFLERKEDDSLLLTCEKQKDQEPFGPVRMELREVAGSCVVGPRTGAGPTLTQTGLSVLQALHRSDMGDGLTSTEWLAVAPVEKSAFMEYRKLLFSESYVTRDKGGRGARYSLTEAGKMYV